MYNLYLHEIHGLPPNLSPYVKVFTTGFEKYLIGKTNPIENIQNGAVFDKNHTNPYKFPIIRAENLIFSVFNKRNVFSDLLIGTTTIPLSKIAFNMEAKIEIKSNLKSGDVYCLTIFIESPKILFPILAYKAHPNFIQFEDNSILSRDIYAYLTFVPLIQDFMAQTIKFEAMELISPTGEYDTCSSIKQLHNIEISPEATYLASTGLTRVMHIKTELNKPDYSYGYKKEGNLFISPYIINEGSYTGTVVINMLCSSTKGKYHQKHDYYDATIDYENKFALLAQIPIVVKGPGLFGSPRALNLEDLSLKPITPIGSFDVKQGIYQVAKQINSPNEIVTSRIISTKERPVSLSEALFIHQIPYPSQLRFELVWEGQSDCILSIIPKDQYQQNMNIDPKWIEIINHFPILDKKHNKSNKNTQTREMDGEGCSIILNFIPEDISYIEFFIHHQFNIKKTSSLGLSLRGDNREITFTPLTEENDEISLGRLQRNQQNIWDFIPFFSPI